MKKVLVCVSIVMLFAAMAASCSHHTCPAYRGSVAEVAE